MTLQPSMLMWWESWGAEPWMDLAREETLLAAAESGHPALCTYGWDAPTLVLGYGQAAASVDLAACARLRVAVVRRLSGGTGVLHRGDLAASLALPAFHPWARRIDGLYDHFVEAVRAALAQLGVTAERWKPAGGVFSGRSPICFEDHRAESLLVHSKKVLGCAQARRQRAVLVHGTLLFHLDPRLQAEVYGVSETRIRDAMAPIPDQAGLSPVPFAAVLARTMAAALALPPPHAVAPPPLSAELAARARDPKWVPLKL